MTGPSWEAETDLPLLAGATGEEKKTSSPPCIQLTQNVWGTMRYLAAIILCVVSYSAQADSFYTLVGYDCDHKNDQLIITYDGAYDAAGKAMIANKRKTQWDPWSLVKIGADGHIGSLKTVNRSCTLRDGRYQISIFPSPDSTNIQGRCGMAMSAGVKVTRDKTRIYSNVSFEPDCFDMDSAVVTRVVIKPNRTKPKVTLTPHNEFYK